MGRLRSVGDLKQALEGVDPDCKIDWSFEIGPEHGLYRLEDESVPKHENAQAGRAVKVVVADIAFDECIGELENARRFRFAIRVSGGQ